MHRKLQSLAHIQRAALTCSQLVVCQQVTNSQSPASLHPTTTLLERWTAACSQLTQRQVARTACHRVHRPDLKTTALDSVLAVASTEGQARAHRTVSELACSCIRQALTAGSLASAPRP